STRSCSHSMNATGITRRWFVDPLSRMNQTTCPLCDSRELAPSWLNLGYNGKDFHYLECTGCGSLICNPMPDDETLQKMYDISYVEPGGDTGEFDMPEKFAEVVELLKTL